MIMPFCVVNAQDIITLKNGGTEQARVLVISQQEVQYKLWSNQDGPTYILSKDSIKSIKFSNGMVQTFATEELTPPTTTSNNQDVAQSITNASTNISNSINTTGGKISTNVGNIAKQQDLYSRARALEVLGYTTSGLCLVGGIVWACVTEIPKWIPCVVGALGFTGCMAAFGTPAANLKREAEELSCSTLMQYNVNDNIALNVQGFNYRPTGSKCYGIGVSLTF